MTKRTKAISAVAVILSVAAILDIVYKGLFYKLLTKIF